MPRKASTPSEPVEPARPRLLIVDDDEGIRTQMKWALAKDYDVTLAQDRASAVEAHREGRHPLVTLDLGLPPSPDGTEEGFAVLAEILGNDPHAKVVVITGHAEREHAMQAVEQGAYDFLSKPVDVDELKIILRRALHLHGLERELGRRRQTAEEEAFEGMLGTSARMQTVFSTIRKVATTDAPVLVTGENGTGKELVARAIHRLGSRGDGPFVAINCGAIPENLLESELFGHEKGAFTGAHIQRKGRIELARGGTLFLDEIGDLPLLLQVKLLRFLQEHLIERVGGREQIEVDVRVIAASNMDLKQAMNENRFREDLYYRIGVVVIPVPPLREREGDIQLMARAFLKRYAEEGNRKITGFTPQAVQAISRHHWPGNVRELENRVKRAVIMAEGARVTPGDLDLATLATRRQGQMLKDAREELERDLVSQSLSRNGGNLTRVAAELGISRPTLYELMEKLGISRQSE